jgi:AcrR family transcriptional regulator
VSTQRGTFIDQARRAQLVGCAIEEIAEVGYSAASLVAIARRAGVSRGVISYHFADKDDLVDQVLASFFDKAAKEIGPRWLPVAGDGVRAQVRALIEANLTFFASEPLHVRAVYEIMLNYRSVTGKRLVMTRPEVTVGRDGLIALLTKGQQTGELRPFDPKVLAIAIRHAIDGFVGELDRDPSFDVVAYSHELTTAIDLAIRPDPAAQSESD